MCYGASFFSVIDPRGDIYICCHHVGADRGVLGRLSIESWSDFLMSSQRHQRIGEFSLDDCLPLCRLNAVNVVLQNLLDGEQFVPITDPLLHKHSVFL